LRQLARTDDERTVLEELLQAYPRSAYVAAARTRLGELAPERAGH
jgi:outer membrane protein assembly factor BamD (BamD/ComL family)